MRTRGCTTRSSRHSWSERGRLRRGLIQNIPSSRAGRDTSGHDGGADNSGTVTSRSPALCATGGLRAIWTTGGLPGRRDHTGGADHAASATWGTGDAHDARRFHGPVGVDGQPGGDVVARARVAARPPRSRSAGTGGTAARAGGGGHRTGFPRRYPSGGAGDPGGFRRPARTGTAPDDLRDTGVGVRRLRRDRCGAAGARVPPARQAAAVGRARGGWSVRRAPRGARPPATGLVRSARGRVVPGDRAHAVHGRSVRGGGRGGRIPPVRERLPATTRELAVSVCGGIDLDGVARGRPRTVLGRRHRIVLCCTRTGECRWHRPVAEPGGAPRPCGRAGARRRQSRRGDRRW